MIIKKKIWDKRKRNANSFNSFNYLQPSLTIFNHLRMSHFVSASQIVANKLMAPSPPKDITVTKNGKSETYTRTYLSYDYGTPQKPVISEALFELRITTAKVKLNKKQEYKLNVIIKDDGDTHGLEELSKGFALVVEKYKNKYGLRNFDPNHPGELRGAFFYPATTDGELIAGAPPMVSLKMNEKTIFKILEPKIDESGNPVMMQVAKIDPITNKTVMVPGDEPDFIETKIDYKTLVDKQLICSVIFNPRDLYRSTGTPLPQLFVRSCMIVAPPTDNGEVEHSKSEMVRSYLQENPEMLNSLADIISKLKVGEKVSLFDTPSKELSPTPSVNSPSVNPPSVNPPLNQIPTLPYNNSVPLNVPQLGMLQLPNATNLQTLPTFPSGSYVSSNPPSFQTNNDLTAFINQAGTPLSTKF